jgi:hypothetical protein
MAREVASVIGSGTVQQTYGILDPADRGALSGAEGVRTGTQVICANPEDFVSVDTFIASGVVVGDVPVEIIGPHLNPLTRCRQITVQNRSATNSVRIGHRPDTVAASGFTLTTAVAVSTARVTLPILHNVSIWAVSVTANEPSELDILIF